MMRCTDRLNPPILFEGGITTGHPHISRRGIDFDPAKPCRHFMRSPAFAARFNKIPETEIFEAVVEYCGSQRGGPLGSEELILQDDNGDNHRFIFETFYNRYDGLTLGVYMGPEYAKIILTPSAF